MLALQNLSQSHHVRFHHKRVQSWWRLCDIPPPMCSQERTTRRWFEREVRCGLRNESFSMSETRIYSTTAALSQDEVKN